MKLKNKDFIAIAFIAMKSNKRNKQVKAINKIIYPYLEKLRLYELLQEYRLD